MPVYPTGLLATADALFFGGIASGILTIWKLPEGSDQASLVHIGDTSYLNEVIPTPLATVNGKLIFRSNWNGYENMLWVSNENYGVPLCTTCGYQVSTSERTNYVSFGGKIFFAASDTEHGSELWVSDGTDAGTHLLYDIFPGPVSSGPGHLFPFGNRLLFFAYDGVAEGGHGYELWKYELLQNQVYLPMTRR
jgi:ELWxxDGT repeat protein